MNKRKLRCPLEELNVLVAESYSWAQVSRKLSDLGYYSELGELQQRVREANINHDHFKGQGWNKGNLKVEDKLKVNSIPNVHINYILQFKERKCEKCGLTSWMNEQIPLELHHIDGDKRNNSLDNLQILCPNCHSLTDNFRGRGIDRPQYKISDEQFVGVLRRSKNIRKALLELGLTPKGGNYSRAYSLAVKNNIQHLLEH